MREVNLSAIDLNLLPPLRALLHHRNVTQAALECGLSQPAMSRALARLRDLLDDPLLVRVSRGYVLTSLAQTLLPRIETALSDVQGLFRPRGFDPREVSTTVRIVASDAQTILLGPALARLLTQRAPNVTVRFESYGPDLPARWESGEIDFAFALASTALPPGAVSEDFAVDHLALVMRRDHPAAGRDWAIADYGHYGHAVIALIGDAASELDARLALHGVKRRIVSISPNFVTALAVVAGSDLVTTQSRRLAERFVEAFGLALRDPPFENPSLRMRLVWSHLRKHDPFLAWFRGLLHEAAGEVYGQNL